MQDDFIDLQIIVGWQCDRIYLQKLTTSTRLEQFWEYQVTMRAQTVARDLAFWFALESENPHTQNVDICQFNLPFGFLRFKSHDE